MALSVRFHDNKKEVEVKGFESTMASRNLTTKVLIPSLSTVNHNEREFQVKLWNLVDFTKRYDESLVATLPKPSIFSKAAQILCLRIVMLLFLHGRVLFYCSLPATPHENVIDTLPRTRQIDQEHILQSSAKSDTDRWYNNYQLLFVMQHCWEWKGPHLRPWCNLNENHSKEGRCWIKRIQIHETSCFAQKHPKTCIIIGFGLINCDLGIVRYYMCTRFHYSSMLVAFLKV